MFFFLSEHEPVLSALSVAWALYIAVLTGWIVMQKRAPAATLGWILSLALLPYIGFAIYYFLGPQRLRKNRSRRLRNQAHLFVQADITSLRKVVGLSLIHI